jgi:1-phosphofructokinase family hexose kinase
LAAGLSPAWQQVVVLDELRTGEVNRAHEVRWCGSGKVLNVGIALAHLARSSEIDCKTLSVIGPRAREAIAPELAALGVDCRWIETRAESRICTTIVERVRGRTTELVENAAPLTSEEMARFGEAFAEESAGAEVVVLTGSLPAGVPTTFYRDLLQRTSARAVLDARGVEMLAALDCQPLVVKPNREELARTLNRNLDANDGLHAAMCELNERGAQWVIVTSGPDALWASHDGDVYRFEPPRVEHVQNPIGSGDCLAAGIAWATVSGVDMPQAIRLGIAAATDNVGQLLPARLDRARIAAGIEQATWSRTSA